MVRRRVFLVFLSSCAVVSGLDDLHLDDGGIIDAAFDVAPADVAVDQDVADASSDSPDGGDVITPPKSDGIPCGGNLKPCTGTQMCCGVNNGGGNYTFSCETTCGDASIRLSCDDPTECDAGLVCCIVSDIVSTCSQQCIQASLELCSGPGQCPNNTTCVPYDSGVMHTIGASHCQ
jgi:hypothetical protein